MDTLTSELDYPMVIVTTAADGERSGCLVGFQTQSSIQPRRWAVWISRTNHTFGVAQRAPALAVHFPSIDDCDLASLFGERTGDEIDKFSRCEWTDGPHGVPLLDRIPNRFVGTGLRWFDDGGDHVCVTLDTGEGRHEHPLRPLTFQAVRAFEAGHPA